jgi:hypothetical protein
LSPGKVIGLAVVLLTAVALGYLALLPLAFSQFLSAPKPMRIVVSLLLLLPLGMLLGMFFPTGIRIISTENRQFVPWAWGINGCASVIGTVLSIIIAMTYGFSTVTILAVIVYIIGVNAMIHSQRETGKKQDESQTG